MSFIEQLFKQLKRHPKRIVFPDGADERVQTAAFEYASKELGIPILLGNKEEIQNSLKNRNLTSPFIKVIEPKKADDFKLFVSHLEKINRYRGIAISEGESIVSNPNYFATMMVQHGQADGLVGGANIGAGSLLRPLFQIIKPLPGVKTISSCTLLKVPNCEYGHQGLFVLGDCSIIPHPSVEQLCSIAVESAKFFRQMTGEIPRVAMLSYSTKGNAPTQDAEKIIAATALAKRAFSEQNIQASIDGEFQADVALVESIAATKAPGSLVAGKANVLIFPDLNSGSISCRLLQRLAKAEAFGQILLGLEKPSGDVSRGASSHEILGVAAMIAVQAINYRNLYPEAGAFPGHSS